MLIGSFGKKRKKKKEKMKKAEKCMKKRFISYIMQQRDRIFCR